MSLTLYLVIGLTTVAGLHWAAAKSAFSTKAQRTALGAGTGALSYGIFAEWTSTLVILDASIAGELSFYGFIYASGFFALLGVWGWNLYTTRKYLVR